MHELEYIFLDIIDDHLDIECELLLMVQFPVITIMFEIGDMLYDKKTQDGFLNV